MRAPLSTDVPVLLLTQPNREFRIAFTTNGKCEIRVYVFLIKLMSTWMRIVEKNCGLS